MNETINPNSAPDVTWSTSDDQMREFDRSMFEYSENSTPAAVVAYSPTRYKVHTTPSTASQTLPHQQ
jgi:hypothetical protein